MFDFTTGVIVYSVLVAALFLGLWAYYDRRDFRRFEGARRRTTFFCVRCDNLYSIQGHPEVAVCPRCGHQNTRLKF